MDDRRENLSVISKLKVAETGTDALAARLFFERLLTAADFYPPGLPQKSIVCIRKLYAAQPLRGGRFGSRTNEWERIVRAEVEKLSRRAFRPARETVPATAESVIFEDRAEMLACLARDRLRGILSEHWWWRGLFPELSRARTILNIWLEAAEFVPGAIKILAGAGKASEFIASFEPFEAAALLDRIVRVFGLQKLAVVLAAPIGGVKASATGAGKSRMVKRRAAEDKLTVAKAPDLRFENLFAGLNAANLSFAQRCLLEAGLLLAHAPRLARSAEFAERVENLRLGSHRRKTPPGREAKGVKEKIAARKKRVLPAPEIAQTKENKIARPAKLVKPADRKTPAGSARKPEKFDDFAESVADKLNAPPAGQENFAAAADRRSEIETSSKIEFETAQTAFETGRSAPPQSVQSLNTGAPETRDSAFEDIFKNPADELADVFQTRFGGVFYLLNLGLFLGLYRDFTGSPDSEIELGVWDFVALVSVEFLGEQVKADEVWRFLKQAAERTRDEDFGAEFDRAKAWRVPVAWLESFPKNGQWRWSKKNGRVILRHDGGFNVVDVPVGKDPEAQVLKEAESYRDYFGAIVRAKNDRQSKPQTWLRNFFEYLQKRLFRALNLESAAELNAVLFARTATVAVSAAHLEITFRLADLPIEIRLAGIDRDPGWIPSAGKYVYFHFV